MPASLPNATGTLQYQRPCQVPFTSVDGEFVVSWYEAGDGQNPLRVEVHAADGTMIAAISEPSLQRFHWTAAGFAALAVGGEEHLRLWSRDGSVVATRPRRALAAASDAHGGTVVVELPSQDTTPAPSPVPELLWVDPSGRVTRTVVLDGSADLAPGTDVLSANVVALAATDHVLVILNRSPPGTGIPSPVARWFGATEPLTPWFDASAGLLSGFPLLLADGRLALNGSFAMARGWSVFPDGVARVDPAPGWLGAATALYRRSIVVIRRGRGYAVFGGSASSLPPSVRGVDILSATGDPCGVLPLPSDGGTVGVDGTVFLARTSTTSCELSWWSGLLR